MCNVRRSPGETLRVFPLSNWTELDVREGSRQENIPIVPLYFAAKLNDDGTLTIVVAAEDPGFGNWISTDGHTEGTWAMGWIRADSHPIPMGKVVKL